MTIALPHDAVSTQNLLDDVTYLTVALYGPEAVAEHRWLEDDTAVVFLRVGGKVRHLRSGNTLPQALTRMLDVLRGLAERHNATVKGERA